MSAMAIPRAGRTRASKQGAPIQQARSSSDGMAAADGTKYGVDCTQIAALPNRARRPILRGAKRGPQAFIWFGRKLTSCGNT
jgi:hypothetical protein